MARDLHGEGRGLFLGFANRLESWSLCFNHPYKTKALLKQRTKAGALQLYAFVYRFVLQIPVFICNRWLEVINTNGG